MHCIRTQANSTQCVVLWSRVCGLADTAAVVRPFSEKQCKTHFTRHLKQHFGHFYFDGQIEIEFTCIKVLTSISQNMNEMDSLCHWFIMHRIHLVAEGREYQWNIIPSVQNRTDLIDTVKCSILYYSSHTKIIKFHLQDCRIDHLAQHLPKCSISAMQFMW